MGRFELAFALFGVAICFGGAFFAAWQGSQHKKIREKTWNLPDFKPFQDLPFVAKTWFIAVPEKVPSSHPLLPSLYRKTVLYRENVTPYAEQLLKNKYEATLTASQRVVEVIGEWQKFTQRVTKISYADTQTQRLLVEVSPALSFNIDYHYTVADNQYRLVSLSGLKSTCDLCKNGHVIGRLGMVGMQRVTMIAASEEIDPVALITAFDLFSRYAG
jgi:hypothetical protein